MWRWMASRLVIAATALLGAVLLVGGHSAGQQLGTLTVTPSGGPVGTKVVLEGQGCADSGSSPAVVFEGVAGQGTVGGAAVTGIDVSGREPFRVTFVIPAELHQQQGQGGGPVLPGIYYFNSHPPYCQARFEVTPGGLPETGGRPPSARELTPVVVIASLLILVGLAFINAARRES